MDVQLFVHPKSKTARKAQRFFSDRRVQVHVVDVTRRPPSPGELRKWVQRFGAESLLDASSKSYQEQGLRYVSASEDDWVDRMIADPSVLDLPLARCGDELAVGDDPDAWQRMAENAKGRR